MKKWVLAASLSLLAIPSVGTARSIMDLPQYQIYLLANPSEAPNRGEVLIPFTLEVRVVLESVNSSVNRSIIPRDDAPDRDVWSRDVRYGDCDDYVMTKRSHLIKLGFSPRALVPMVTRAPNGETHLVLLVKTTSGTFVMDNLKSRVTKR